MANDPELERLFRRIDSLESDLRIANSEMDTLRPLMDDAWADLQYLRDQYNYYKDLATEEFEAASLCWESGDKFDAKEHSINAHLLKDRQHEFGSCIDDAKARHSSFKSSFDEAKARRNEILEHLKYARAEKNRRLDELKEQNAERRSHWHEKNCQRCGATIRYNDEWSHSPNFCKDCKEKFAEEKAAREAARKEREAKWREKPCKGCGAMIRYNVDWDNPPNYCNKCKEKFKVLGKYQLRFDP